MLLWWLRNRGTKFDVDAFNAAAAMMASTDPAVRASGAEAMTKALPMSWNDLATAIRLRDFWDWQYGYFASDLVGAIIRADKELPAFHVKFLTGLMPNYLRYGHRLRLSSKQWDVLREIAELVGIEVSGSPDERISSARHRAAEDAAAFARKHEPKNVEPGRAEAQNLLDALAIARPHTAVDSTHSKLPSWMNDAE